jgi:hypothetical protein
MDLSGDTDRASQTGHEGKETPLLVITEADDRFSLPLDLALRGFKPFGALRAYLDQLGMVLGRLRRWTEDYRDKLARAYLVPGESGLLFLVVRKATLYDEALESLLSDLDIAIAQDPDLGMIELNVRTTAPVSEDDLRSYYKADGLMLLAPGDA